MARQFGVSDRTMRGVLAALARNGVVVRTRGLGTMVADSPPTRGRRVGIVGLPVGQFWYVARFYSDLCVPLFSALAAGGVTTELLDARWLDELSELPADSDSPGSPALRQLADIDALLVIDPARIDLLDRVGRTLPVVVANVPPGGGAISYVAFDHAAGVERAIDHLWALGHRRIGCWGQLYIRSSAVTSAGVHEERYDAFVRILSHRLGMSPEIAWMQLAWNATSWRRAVDRWMNMPPAARPTAIVCRGGTWALLWQLVRRGVRVGRDVSVIALERITSLSECLDFVRRRGPQWIYPYAGLQELDPQSRQGRRLASLIPTAVIPDTLTMGQVVAEEVLRRIAPAGAAPRVQLVQTMFHEGNTTRRPVYV